MARSSSTGGAPGGGYSGSSYDRWSYEQASRTGTGGSNDNPLNKLQYKYWVTKSKVVRKLGKDQDECVVASDAELGYDHVILTRHQMTNLVLNFE